MEKKLSDLLDERDKIEKEIEVAQGNIAKIYERLSAVKGDIEGIISEPVKAVRMATGKDTGTVDVLVQGVMVKHSIQKKVIWDQEILATVREKIKASGDNPDDYSYAKTTYGVTEKKYNGFPETIKKVFEPARLVKGGHPTITFDRR